MINNNFKKILNWLTVLIWAAIIFILSDMDGNPNSPYGLWYFLVRKIFHIIEYFILTLLLCRAFFQDFYFKKTLALSILFSFLYASSDEWHQTFVFGREGTLRDVMIDLIGIFLAAIFILKFNSWKKK